MRQVDIRHSILPMTFMIKALKGQHLHTTSPGFLPLHMQIREMAMGSMVKFYEGSNDYWKLDGVEPTNSQVLHALDDFSLPRNMTVD